ncbi:MAG: sensor histidine kinase [Solirubrobacteraceae bacterium]
MVSLGSSTRSAARATFSAYRTVPIRWRLAGGSAVLTFVILASFAAVVGVLTDRLLTGQFVDQMNYAIEYLEVKVQPQAIGHALDCDLHVNLANFANSAGADYAQIRVMDDVGDVLCTQMTGLSSAQEQALAPRFTVPLAPGSYVQDGYRVEAHYITWRPVGEGWLIYARPLSSLDHTLGAVRLFLLFGVLGGTVLALLAGLANAQRAMRPITQLTEAAREIERTRDPSRHVPHPEAEDEIAELARTLEGMLGALDEARAATEAALSRQREFVADASHELRTPLTSVLANLELLTDELSGEQAESAKAALRSTRRMRRLVGDLLLLARADAQRAEPYRPTDLAQVLIDAAGEIEPLADDHELTVEPSCAVIPGRGDDLHRMILNLLENAVRHTPKGTHVRARAWVENGVPSVLVEDDGPGIPPALQGKVFERFVRGGGDGGRGSGLGLAIVRAVAESHGASIELGQLTSEGGTRFVIRFVESAGTRPAGESAPQTSTTTGSTIGRRRSRS